MRPAPRWTVALSLGLAACGTPGLQMEPDGTWFMLPVPRNRAQRLSGSWNISLDTAGTFLQPNAADSDGTPGWLHVTDADMPLVVSIGLPREPPKYGSRKDARRVAIEGMQLWESAIQPSWPSFALRFVENDPSAPVQIEWKRELLGSAVGRAWIHAGIIDGQLRVGGHMSISTRASKWTRLTVDEVRLVVAHEFGHVIGLYHCLDCDSAMNYAWHTRDRILVTETDAATFLALTRQPSGHRVDGKPLAILQRAGWLQDRAAESSGEAGRLDQLVPRGGDGH